MNTNWNDKEEYLQFVQDWKRNYKALSASIRGSRLDSRIEQSQAAGGVRYGKVTKAQLAVRSDERGKALKSLKVELGPFWDASALATALLVIRREQKERAGLARAASLAVVESA